MKKMISNIVFTKNRPLQLEGYLESLYRHFPAEIIQTYILYKVELFEESYEQLFRKYPTCIVIEETDFSKDFFRILSQIDTKYILFGIDDVVYFDSVDFDVIEGTFREHSKNIFGFTLRFSPESLKDSHDIITEITVADQTIYKLNWQNGKTSNTRYPFELCATVYPTGLIKRIINNVSNNSSLIRALFSPGSAVIKVLGKITSTRSILKSFGYFYSPNTLESWNCRWCQNHSEQLPNFLYFQKQCASAIQVNMVNTSTNNTTDGDAEHTVEILAEKYKQGYSLDIGYIAKNKPTDTHSGSECFRLIQKT